MIYSIYNSGIPLWFANIKNDNIYICTYTHIRKHRIYYLCIKYNLKTQLHPQRQRRLPDHPAHNIDRAPEDDAATTGNTSIRLALAAAEAAVVTSQPCWMGTPLIGTVVEGGVVGGALVAE